MIAPEVPETMVGVEVPYEQKNATRADETYTGTPGVDGGQAIH